MTETDGGSDDEQTTTPVENPSTPETPKATYTVTFDANGGSGTIASITEVAGAEITLPTGAEFSEAGFDYTFVGWNTKANATGENYAAGKKITLNSNFTLYAKWGLTAENALKKSKALPKAACIR